MSAYNAQHECTGEQLDELKQLLPEVVLDIADVIGMVATKSLIATLGGLDFAIPRGVENSKREQLIVQAVGRDAADKLMAAYGGARLYIPRCDDAFRALRNRQFREAVLAAVNRGMSQKEAIQYHAPRFGFSERLAYKILGQKLSDSKQMQLL